LVALCGPIAGESLYALSKRHDISRQLIRVWVEKYEAGALDEDAQAADLNAQIRELSEVQRTCPELVGRVDPTLLTLTRPRMCSATGCPVAEWLAYPLTYPVSCHEASC
jgi:transposase-like protein